MESAKSYPFEIIHVSGMPGSGKTYLGAKAEKAFGASKKIIVVDTDSLIDDNNKEGQELLRMAEDETDQGGLAYNKRWKELFMESITCVIERARLIEPPIKVLLFVGILDHFAAPDQPPLLIDSANRRFVIEISKVMLLNQFYTRYGKSMAEDSNFWDGLAEGRYEIPSSAEFSRSADTLNAWHKQNGYEAKTSYEILEVIKAILRD
jgi:hypothetical protein